MCLTTFPVKKHIDISSYYKQGSFANKTKYFTSKCTDKGLVKQKNDW